MFKKLITLAVTLTLILGFAANVSAMTNPNLRTIKLNDNGNMMTVVTLKRTVGEFLQDRGVTLHPKDHVNYDLDHRLVDGYRIEVKRAFPIKITIDDVQSEFWVAPESRVGNVLTDLREQYGHGFYHTHSTNERLTPESSLIFYSVVYDVATEREPIEFETEIVLTEDLLVGETQVYREGKLGVLEYTYDVSTRYGDAPVFTLAKTEVIRKPVNRVELFGIRQPEPEELPEIDLNAPKEYYEKLVMDSTAYSLDYGSTRKLPSHPAYGITKSGIYAVPGVVAVDPRVIPLGSILYVDGYGYALAADIGSAIKGMKIDLFFEDVNVALRYGRKKVNVYIVQFPEPEDLAAVAVEDEGVEAEDEVVEVAADTNDTSADAVAVAVTPID